MSRREYKTVAMPQLLKARRRRGQSRAEMVAEIVSAVINKQASMGWRYVGTDAFRTAERRAYIGAPVESVYTVLVFDREADSMPALEDPAKVEAAARRRNGADPEPRPRPRPGGFRFGDGAVAEAMESVRRRPGGAEDRRPRPRRRQPEEIDEDDEFDVLGPARHPNGRLNEPEPHDPFERSARKRMVEYDDEDDFDRDDLRGPADRRGRRKF